MKATPRLVVIVGTPGSGKDLVIQAVDDLGAQHALVVPKHTTRNRQPDDQHEMICVDDPGFNISACDVKYENFGDTYGIESRRIWEGLAKGSFQVVVVSNVGAINHLRELFGDLMLLVFVHSEMTAEDFGVDAAKDDEYFGRRREGYRRAIEVYLENFTCFDHVLLYADVKEDLFDQIFRLFRAYEARLI